MKKVRKAIISAAELETRILTVTKSMPNLSIKYVLQHDVLEESLEIVEKERVKAK
ncbi:hypothetical protein [Niallia sp. 03190]|uniref:hypothetical protein n=1 Tax=Niallia sp. 03190 TaxID=3458061 RepID=UPI00404454F1